MSWPVPRVKSPKEELETPCLLIDLDRMERNLARMAEFFRGKSAKLRPHAKTHKSPIIAHKQLKLGAIGITCAKLGEAEVLVESGIRDILIANQIVDRAKVSRLAQMARLAQLIVAVDQSQNVEDLAEATRHHGSRLRILIEVDIGMHRCGVPPGEPALDLARKVKAQKSLEFAGLMGYEGHAVLKPTLEERAKLARKAVGELIETRRFLERAGVEVPIVSAGGTGTYTTTGTLPGVTEIQAGTYVFSDAKRIQIGVDFEPALSVLSTVVSRPKPGVVVLDGGMKSISQDLGPPIFRDLPNLAFARLNAEHAVAEIREGSGFDLKVGDKVELIPSYGDTTINLHDAYVGLRQGRVETVWPVAARGHFW
jgi:D-serine deaminase-like pyridoxal phosphate-dependent protein